MDRALRRSVLDQGLADDIRAAALSAMENPGIKMLGRLAASPKTPLRLQLAAGKRLMERARKIAGAQPATAPAPPAEPKAEPAAAPIPQAATITKGIEATRAAIDRIEGTAAPAAEAKPATNICPPEATVPALAKKDLSVEQCIQLSNWARMQRPESPPERPPARRRLLGESFSREREVPRPAPRPALTAEEHAAAIGEFYAAMTARFERMGLSELAEWFA